MVALFFWHGQAVQRHMCAEMTEVDGGQQWGGLGGSASADSRQRGLPSGPPQPTLQVAAAGDAAGTTLGSQDVVETRFHL